MSNFTPEQQARELLEQAEALLDPKVVEAINKYGFVVASKAPPMHVFIARRELVEAIQDYAYNQQ